jgi:hypothetical protein
MDDAQIEALRRICDEGVREAYASARLALRHARDWIHRGYWVWAAECLVEADYWRRDARAWRERRRGLT